MSGIHVMVENCAHQISKMLSLHPKPKHGEKTHEIKRERERGTAAVEVERQLHSDEGKCGQAVQLDVLLLRGSSGVVKAVSNLQLCICDITLIYSSVSVELP